MTGGRQDVHRDVYAFRTPAGTVALSRRHRLAIGVGQTFLDLDDNAAAAPDGQAPMLARARPARRTDG
jgi:hypothetical protein